MGRFVVIFGKLIGFRPVASLFECEMFVNKSQVMCCCVLALTV